jgi:hypothetical protein
MDILSQCLLCARLQAGFTCAAFPEGIPDTIAFNHVDHREPQPNDRGSARPSLPASRLPAYHSIHVRRALLAAGRTVNDRLAVSPLGSH